MCSCFTWIRLQAVCISSTARWVMWLYPLLFALKTTTWGKWTELSQSQRQLLVQGKVETLLLWGFFLFARKKSFGLQMLQQLLEMCTSETINRTCTPLSQLRLYSAFGTSCASPLTPQSSCSPSPLRAALCLSLFFYLPESLAQASCVQLVLCWHERPETEHRSSSPCLVRSIL